MGGQKKKKKRTTATTKADHSSSSSDAHHSSINDELTALSAIFDDDCHVSGSLIAIKIRRPNVVDDDDGDGESDLDSAAALLLVRCPAGYPSKPAKVRVEGLTDHLSAALLPLLRDQAASNAREARVAIFDLVEAAQEFLSRIAAESRSQSVSQPTAVSSDLGGGGGTCVHVLVDLFGGSGEWGITDSGSKLDRKPVDHLQKLFQGTAKTHPVPPLRSVASAARLRTLQEETATVISPPQEEDEDEEDEEDFSFDNEDDEDDDYDVEADGFDHESDSSNSISSTSSPHDLIMVHLLRLACASNGPLSNSLQQVSAELYDLGILSEKAKELATEPSLNFNKIFDHAFQKHQVSSKKSPLWKHCSEIEGTSTSLQNSRYLNDFEELHSLGHGGFGYVVLCKNKIDGRQYAVKKIRLKDKSLPIDDRILREVATLSRLQHQHVVRYYQAWFETGFGGVDGDSTMGSRTAASSSFSFTGAGSVEALGQDNKLESTYLYIQMEYCPRTLRQVFDSYNHFDKELAWHLSRQIVEGLAHIHGQGIIHRDLTPNNIFFDARNDIKIGDFGLAKFLKLEQLEQESIPVDTPGASIEGTGQVGTYFYTAPEIEQGWPKIDEKADMYSLGIVFFELWHPFGTAMERQVVLSDLKQKGELPARWVAEFPEQASLLRRLMSSSPSERPSATELLHHAFPPRMESELLDNILRTMQTSEDPSIYDKVVNAIFDETPLSIKDQPHHTLRFRSSGAGASAIQCSDLETEVRDYITEISKEVFRKHCAKHLELIPVRMLDGNPQLNRNTVKLLTHGGDMLELCHELRLPFISWVISTQKSSFKRYEISCVYRRAVGHSPPNRYLQGDFDIIGGESALTEADVIKATMDIVMHFLSPHCCDIHLNHGSLLDAIWSWIGIKADQRQKVAELLSMTSCLRPQSSERKSRWGVIRCQLLQELKLPEAAVNRLQTFDLRFCGAADQALARLRGALPSDKATRKALDELSELTGYLRTWGVEEHAYIDPLMPPTEDYHKNIFFQVYLIKENNSAAQSDGILHAAATNSKQSTIGSDGTLLAIGGRYDYLLHQMWGQEYKSNAPGAVGTSIALETIIRHSLVNPKLIRKEDGISILVCSRGGGGLLEERMQLVGELWEENIKAEFVPKSEPSLTEQYEYASEHDIKCLVIIRDTGMNHEGSVKVRHLENKREKDVERGKLVKFLLDAIAVQFRNPSIWS